MMINIFFTNTFIFSHFLHYFIFKFNAINKLLLPKTFTTMLFGLMETGPIKLKYHMVYYIIVHIITIRQDCGGMSNTFSGIYLYTHVRAHYIYGHVFFLVWEIIFYLMTNSTTLYSINSTVVYNRIRFQE